MKLPFPNGILPMLALGLICLFLCGFTAPAPPDVLWTSTSKDATGSMPIGNGVVGGNVWVDQEGVLHFLIARTDSWSEICRLLKLGEVEVKLTPNPFKTGFRQRLSTKDGVISFAGDGLTMKLYVDPGQPVVWITGLSGTPVQVQARLTSWRTKPHTITGDENVSAWTMKGDPEPLTELADHFPAESGCQIVYHRNMSSIVGFTMKHQGMQAYQNLVGDPLLHRAFGSILTLQHLGAGANSGANTAGDEGGWLTLKSSKKFAVKLATACEITPTASAFINELRKVSADAGQPSTALTKTVAWWNRFWDRSWIDVTAPKGSDAKTVAECTAITRSYALQRFMEACASRGAYPFKFNGSIFTVAPTWFGKDYDPDYRRWGDGYWWQNTRIPYFAMVAAGDFSEMDTLFRLYQSVLPICEARAKFYYGAKGAYFPETMSFFGMYSNSDYGWDRKPNQPANEFEADWWKYAYNQGPELVQMMLDRYLASPNAAFLKRQLIPTARQILLYFETRFPRDDQGRLKLTPDQVIETYWTGVINDTPDIAGLHAILPQLLKLPGLPKADRASWKHLLSILPPVTVKDDRIMPAQAYNPERTNVENPEFYAIWPFNVFGVMEGNATIAAKTFNERIEKANYGWQYDGQTAALAGLTNEAKKSLVSKVANSNKHFRFPAMWGPNYDWLPDQCHGGNIMLTLQSMLLQTNPLTGQIKVGVAWPKEWDVHFRLYSRANKVVTASIVGGKVSVLHETPATKAGR